MNVVIATKWFILQWLILCNTNFTLIFQKLEKIIIIPSLGSEDSLEEDMATHFSILAWRSPADRGVWRATVHGVKKSWTRLSNWGHTHTHTHTHTQTWEKVETDSLSKLRQIVMDREAWHAAVHVVTKGWTQLNNWATTRDDREHEKGFWRVSESSSSWLGTRVKGQFVKSSPLYTNDRYTFV